jgi:hypothetical protein
MFHSRLPLLSQKETAAYISSRLAAAGCSDSSLFPDEAVEDIYASSHGIPRVVNLLCEHALISAYAEQQRVVSPKMIQRIAMDFDLLAEPLAVAEANLQPHYGRLAPFSFIEKPASPAVAVPRFTECSWTQIEFDIFNEPHAAVEAPAQPAVREDQVPAVHAPAHQEPHKLEACAADSPDPGKPSKIVRYWRKHRSRPGVAVFARNSVASAERAGYAFVHSFACYIRSVSHSFLRDCRVFFRSLALPTPALEFGPSSGSTNEKSAMQQSVLAPIIHWLRQPVTLGHFTSKGSPSGSSRRK